MIRRVVLRRFKRFAEQPFDLEGHVVLAGPNNMGKTTVLQAIAAWNLSLMRWKQLNNFQRRGGYYEKAPIARQAFSAVPVRNFEWLWNERSYKGVVEVELQAHAGWTITMEFEADSSEQIYVRPSSDASPDVVRAAQLTTTYVPPMTGLSTEEPVLQRPKVDQLLGQARPGEIIRNLLLEANASQATWNELQDSLRRLFGYQMRPPDGSGADIVAEYESVDGGPAYDICSAGSGFQQVLMLLTFLHTRPGSVLLLDEPDSHLHVILQDAIYGELCSVAARSRSQLIIATHSEVIINSVPPEELCLILDEPRRLSSVAERRLLARALAVLSQTDVMLATSAKGILYVEGHTDIALLREWARVLNHPVYHWLGTTPFWRAAPLQHRDGAEGISARAHYEALSLIRSDLPALILLDSDGKTRAGDSEEFNGRGLQRTSWRRYETESYLVHPAALERFVADKLGGAAAGEEGVQGLAAALTRLLASHEVAETFRADPFHPQGLLEGFLKMTKARTDILPVLIEGAGLHGFDYTRFYEIAAMMRPEEIHPEVVEKLDIIQQALRL